MGPAYSGMRLFLKCSFAMVLAYSVHGSGGDQPTGFSKTGVWRSRCERIFASNGLLKYLQPVRARIESSGPDVIDADPRSYLIDVKAKGQSSYHSFRRTNRDLYDLKSEHYYPREFLDRRTLEGKKVLDLACGDGRLVDELRRMDIDIVGLDAHLTEYQRTKDYFVQASADQTGFPDGHFDIVISTQGPITYLYETDPEFTRKIFKEVSRILKPNGLLRISPFYSKNENFDFDSPNLERDFAGTALSPLPSEWQISRSPDQQWFRRIISDDEGSGPKYWLELQRK